MKPWLQTLLLGAGFGGAFLLGQRLPVATAAGGGEAVRGEHVRSELGRSEAGGPAVVGTEPMVLAAQGRGPINAPPPPPRPGTTEEPGEPVVVYTEENHQAAQSGNGFLAVTGSYGVGTTVLYLVDTVNRQLAVYEARGGSSEQRRIVLVGARRIDLDLQLEGYNDRSEYDYRGLQDLFRRRGRKDPDVRTGLENPNSSRR